uniref:LRRNT domain-containing protein n=1 Tax=Periophthalmus magnuspinnatus TaxID=409849 RepID=A0A3B4AN06_9GOBI
MQGQDVCWTLVILFILVMIVVSPILGQGCPQRCECVSKLKTVSCNNKRLSALPEAIPSDTRILDLSGNKLRWVEHGDLVLEPNAFSSLQNLQSLSLRGNQLKLVPMGAFSRLTNLTSLDLSGNKIVILLDFTFQDLKSLKNLEVGDNDLVYIEGAFQSVNTLETVRLDGNPLACDCRLLWILQRRKTLNFDSAPPVCTTPVEVQGRALSAFSDSALFEHFTCQKPKIHLTMPTVAFLLPPSVSHFFLLNVESLCLTLCTPVTPHCDISVSFGIRLKLNHHMDMRLSQQENSA